MTALRVWAPRAKEIAVVCQGNRHAMHAAERGYWEAEVDELLPDADYAFSIDGGPTRPDPRSAWQPAGVHGPSRWVDHNRFAWSDSCFRPKPWPQAIIYELHVGAFSAEGTFEGAIPHIDHLVALGVTHLELMPVAAFPGERGWGYDGVSLYAPQASYGGPVGLKRLVDACHARGLAVILDVVYNHLGPSGNYLAEFGPYFTKRHQTPWGPAINFDDSYCDEVRRFFFDNAIGWLTHYHIDGLRVDAVHAMVDTGAVHFLEELAGEVRAASERLGRACVLVAESDLNDPRLVTAPSSGGYGLDSMWSDDLHHALHAVLTGERSGYYQDFGSVAALAKALRDGFVYDGVYSNYRYRRHGRSSRGLNGSQFVVCSQNHDQVGNRARGERLSRLTDPATQMIAAAVVLTSPFVPLLFQGEEWAATSPFLYFTDHQEQDLAQAIREGRRREFAAFGWSPEQVPDPQAIETFQASRLIWSECSLEPHKEVLAWYRALIVLRHAARELQAGALRESKVTFDEQIRWLIIERGRFVVAVAFGEAGATITLPSKAVEMLLDSSSCAQLSGSRLLFSKRAAAIIRLARSGDAV